MPRFTNQAQLRYGNSVTNSNIAVGEILEVLSMTKTAVRDQYDPNGPITYVISILNSGTLPINGLTLTDNLGAYASGTATLTPLNYLADSVKYYVNGVLQTTPTVTAGPPLSITGINVPATYGISSLSASTITVVERVIELYVPKRDLPSHLGEYTACILWDSQGKTYLAPVSNTSAK